MAVPDGCELGGFRAWLVRVLTEGDALGAGFVLKSRPTGIPGLLGFQ